MKKLLSAVVAMVMVLGISNAFAAEKKAAKPAEKKTEAAAPAKADDSAAAKGMYWEKWEKGKAQGIVPPCGTNVLAVGGDEILQATVDTYCAVKPGKYQSFINPAVMKVYKAKGNKYADGQVAVLQFKEIGVAFTTDIKGGKPVYDVVSLKDGKSIASKEANHPLNPAVCEKCHAGFKNACADRGFTCGNRTDY